MSSGTTHQGSGRGPAPPLPEKPPSVAERTRLLKSSFRKEEFDKPRFSDGNINVTTGNRASPQSDKSSTLPLASSTPTSTNGERSESPSPASSVGSMTGIGKTNNDKNNLDSNKEMPNLNAAKREAFFKGGDSGGGGGPKFDPSSRFGMDRERPAPSLHNKDIDDNRISERERDRKYGDSTKELDGYVGFANLPNQVYRKSVKRGFEFTLMVVGESGLGKSTLINSLFLTDLYSGDYPGPSHRIQKTVKVETTKCLLKENGVQLQLTVVDTPGFGDAVDNSNCWQPVIDFIDSKYDEYLNAESQVVRSISADTRVHCCLYFIAPTGHGLKPLDVEFMKRLHDKVNIIPLIAKADTLTPDECREFKKTILNEIAQHKIRIYEFPECDDEEETKIQKKLRDRVPFAVVGSNRVIEAGGKKIRGRQYPWGIVEVENLEHNDFIALRNMLIRTHMQDLKDVTNNVHYENFRYSKLAPSTADGKIKPGSLTKSFITNGRGEREHDNKMKKMEAEMEQVFEMKVQEKQSKLKESEADLQRRAEHMKKSLEQQQKEIEEKWKNFEREKQQWEDTMGVGKGSSENIKDKAEELCQLVDVRVGSSSLTSLGLTGHCPVIMCLDMAASLAGHPINKADAVRLSGVQKKVYTNGIKALESMLGLQSQTSIRDLAVQFGCTGAIDLASHIIKSYGENTCAEVDISTPLFTAASLCSACRALKLKIDWGKLREVCGVKKSTYDKLVSEMEKIATKFLEEKKVVTHRKTRTLLDDVEQQLNEKTYVSKVQTEEESSEGVDDYEEWKARILESAREKIAARKTSANGH
ncbi:hypothetical protein FSP39_012387 [Pinctada imbricata]|uniref:Origin recognition complex subunit 6 n=1 Tax=Pinctada imbricata TaxID=66713 RepID=A0AA88XI13_PINIB|nr:hypothetical protein FSP39_012387 [Pinctada imbricata]